MPGSVNYRFKDGKLPDHTKQAFKEYGVLTVHGIIVQNALILMHKVKNMPNLLPSSIRQLFPQDMPEYESNFEANINWLQIYNQTDFRSSVFYKGPILSITEHNIRITCPSSLFNVRIYKNLVKGMLLELQSVGIDEEWPPFVLHNLPGLRKSKRIL